MEDEDLRQNVVYRIGTRAVLLLGCERSLLIMLLTFDFVCVFSMQSLIGIVVGLIVLFVCMGILRRMAKYDPYLSEVYRGQVKYQRFYSAHATHFGIPRFYK